jgi:hypothetical protein
VYARFTERARLVVVLAQDAASELGHTRVGTEHVLLGLLAERKGLAAWALQSLGIELEKTRAAVVRLAGAGERPTEGQIPFTAPTSCVMELATVEVDRRGLTFVATEHVLLGLCAQLESDHEDDVARRVLSDSQVTLEQIRVTVERFVPTRVGGLSWILRRTPDVEFRGVQGAGWIDVLSLQPEVHLRRLLIRAAAVALDDDRTVIEARDLLVALGGLPEGAELLESVGLTATPAARVPAAARTRDWTRINAGKEVLAALEGAQRRARETRRGTVALDDLVLTLAVDQASLLSASGWELDAFAALLERRQQTDAG